MNFCIKNDRLGTGMSIVNFIGSPNIGGELKAKFLIIHYTASGPEADTARYFSQDTANVSAHLVVRRDGSVTQCVPFNVVAWHAGKSQWTGKGGTRYSGLNNSAIGIEIENWGPLGKSAGGWVSWTGAAVDGSKVIEARHKFGVPDCGWEVFTTAQIETVIAAAQAICREYAIEDIMGHDDIAPGRKSDPGPAWDMAAFKASVRGGGPFQLNRQRALDIRARIASGEEETFPEDVVSALVAGQHPVRVFRKWRGMTAVALARAAGISQPYLSEIENGAKDGSLSVMKRVAALLNVTLDDLAG
ncbi:N-acetylmuramoyl-L-alanine amidase [Phyllobacterium zundukense]|jgi:N-acetylmuramoyl-L-alanine amidase|uniref:N-acetylmuramoyl-L-alanine amidase n=1 Tax=Phyllobacterium zundukense TaxID=1867719 RepID=A0ACD4D167_9HYPH|nr:N-acetylmuramoyl-L-alanine amidase [Phyllobacterium zundukense]UXN59633.1 N-acetylmuramoyl-L-alanine amidase [Phyllobacterium zundukense]